MSALSLEARVGVFVVAALLVLVGFVLLLGDFAWERGFDAQVDFGFAGSLQAGVAVRVSGIKVGSVENMRLLQPNEPRAATGSVLGQQRRAQVRAELSLFEAARPFLTQGARFAVGTQGVIGEAYLELSPGDPDEAPLDLSVPQRGVDAPALHVMALQAASLLDTFGAFLGGADSQLGTAIAQFLGLANEVVGERRAELSQAVGDFAASAGELRTILQILHKAVGEGRLQALLTDANSAAASLERDLPGLLTRAKTSLAAIDGLATRLNGSLDDDAVKGIITRLAEATQNLSAMSREGQALVQGIRRGEGTIGGLMRDPQIYDDLKEMLRDLKRNPWKLLWRD